MTINQLYYFFNLNETFLGKLISVPKMLIDGEDEEKENADP